MATSTFYLLKFIGDLYKNKKYLGNNKEDNYFEQKRYIGKYSLYNIFFEKKLKTDCNNSHCELCSEDDSTCITYRNEYYNQNNNTINTDIFNNCKLEDILNNKCDKDMTLSQIKQIIH